MDKRALDPLDRGRDSIRGPAMRCPFCGNVDTQVKDSRPAEDHVSIRRRRFCPACGGRFTTYERVQLRDLVVIKSNGRREEFDRDKLERSVRISLQKRPVEPERMDQMISRHKPPCPSPRPAKVRKLRNGSWRFRAHREWAPTRKAVAAATFTT